MRALRAELSRHDWSGLRVITGSAEHVPDAVLRLASAVSEQESDAAYWELENDVVVQGQLFDSAPAVVSALLLALTEDLSRPARSWIMELLFQITAGESHELECDRGNEDLGERSRQAARDGLLILYRELCEGIYDPARKILEMIDPDRERFLDYIAKFPRGDRKKARGRIGST